MLDRRLPWRSASRRFCSRRSTALPLLLAAARHPGGDPLLFVQPVTVIVQIAVEGLRPAFRHQQKLVGDGAQQMPVVKTINHASDSEGTKSTGQCQGHTRRRSRRAIRPGSVHVPALTLGVISVTRAISNASANREFFPTDSTGSSVWSGLKLPDDPVPARWRRSSSFLQDASSSSNPGFKVVQLS